tara:strand:+ start:54 stop:692 length:639 start_codon:yes stop_codon:yes gene_type:complete
MGCITQGHAISCGDRNRRGGIKRIFLAETDGITYGNIAVDGTSGMIDQFTADPVMEFEFERETAGFSANATRENGSTLVDVELTFYLPKITQEVADRLNQLHCACGVVAIVETFADDADASNPQTYFFALGWDQVFGKDAFLEFASGDMQSGVALQDANGTQVTLSGRMGEYPYEINATVLESGTPTAGQVGIVRAGTYSASNLVHYITYGV